MPINQENIKLIFGLKLKQLRLDKKISGSDLAFKTGLSASYINEIEKGKKYPKSEKIYALAQALGVEYDSLVSLKLSKKLEPIADLLNSNILTELPLELFGIDPAKLLELLSEAPDKQSAFIGTLIEIARNYNMSVEQFYFSALRTYQEMYDNYFEEIEDEAERFLHEKNIPENLILDEKFLSDILVKNYHYEIHPIDELHYPELLGVRSLVVPKGDMLRLYISPKLNSNQKSFIYGREIGYQYLKLKKRLFSTSLVQAESFDQILNNYKASYFASAIIIKGNLLAQKLIRFFGQPRFDGQELLDLIQYFHTTPETFCYRLSNLLPKHFGINQLVFLRFEKNIGQDRFDLTKEMHIARKHNPHTVRDEHYCNRWIALTILKELEDLQIKNKFDGTLCKMQISKYIDTTDEYLAISFAKSSPKKGVNMSITMGIRIDAESKSKIKFLNSSQIAAFEVNETCERCAAFDCKERRAAPTVLQRKRKNEDIRQAMKNLIEA
jgi:XRE family transcriptional regulator, fatty acid utilization regulator